MKFKTYVESITSPAELGIFSSIERIMNHFPEDNDYGINHRGESVILSCHIVARAISKIFPSLIVVDGFFHPVFEHSWLETKGANVIDVYPVGMIGGPIFVDRVVAGKFSKHALYKPQMICAQEHFNMPWFTNAVDKVFQSIERGRSEEVVCAM